ncbi:hypothetical protein SEA_SPARKLEGODDESS_254 [Streptomyces phage SparkleGoddess]|uniref:Lipoprotein n=1 Tax=Streptomyces phage SparkleGoddess TaxID=2283305 RepID=A0A345MEF2_9CAUD|nr:hypothetical protein SEA_SPARKLEGODDESS_254 [Streptomyces phage SparkleGoddess]UTN92476.1 hypothetical protein SEA_STIGMA_252 [Streptomyces phage Stigma]
MNKGLSVAALAVVTTLALTACEGSGSSGVTHYKTGKSGIVQKRTESNGTYKLTTRWNSKNTTFKVFSSVYFDCFEGMSYPACVKSPKPKATATPTKNGGVNKAPSGKAKTSAPKSDSNKKSGGFSSGGGFSKKK